MNNLLNLRLKKEIDPSILVKYGFVPKYDEDTGEVKEYIKKIHASDNPPRDQYFTFALETEHKRCGIFRRRFSYDAWMTGFHWDHICKKEALRLLYDLIIDGIVEPAEKE